MSYNLHVWPQTLTFFFLGGEGWGGLVIRYKDYLEYKPVLFNAFGLELSIVSFYNCNCGVCVALLYRPPSSSTAVFDFLFSVLQCFDQVYFLILYAR